MDQRGQLICVDDNPGADLATFQLEGEVHAVLVIAAIADKDDFSIDDGPGQLLPPVNSPEKAVRVVDDLNIFDPRNTIVLRTGFLGQKDNHLGDGAVLDRVTR